MIDDSELHPCALALLRYWQSIHPSEGLPGRQHFDPSAVAAILPNLVLVEVHRAPLRFRYRVLGTCIDAALGQALTGKWLDEAHAGHACAAEVLEEYRSVAVTKSPLWRRSSPVIVSEPECLAVEVLRLPLASNGVTVDMVLGVTLYFDAAGDPVEAIAYKTLGYHDLLWPWRWQVGQRIPSAGRL